MAQTFNNFTIKNLQLNKASNQIKNTHSHENLDNIFNNACLKIEGKRQFGKDIKNVINERNNNKNFYFKIDKDYNKQDNIKSNKFPIFENTSNVNNNENSNNLDRHNSQKNILIPPKSRDESSNRFRHYTLRSRININRDSSKENKESCVNSHSFNNPKKNNEIICLPLKKMKSNLQNDKNFFEKNFLNFEVARKNSNCKNLSFINLNQGNKKKLSEKNQLNGVYPNLNTTSNFPVDPTNKNISFNNLDLYENDSINKNDITFNIKCFDNKNKFENQKENVNPLLNKEIINNDLISENFSLSMEIDDRQIPEFSICRNKFITNTNEAINSNALGIKNNNLIQIQDNNRYDFNPNLETLKSHIQKYVPDVTYNSNPEQVKDYIDDIFNHLKRIQHMNNTSSTYMRDQTDINEKMRGILIDWIVEVHLKFKLLPETLFLTINLIDRFLCERNILRTKLQLVGVTCLFIACKYEEIYPPEVKDFVFITDNAYTKQEIIEMENEVLSVLKFEITTPSALRYLEFYKLYLKIDENSFMFCRYLLELFLLEYRMNKYNPHLMACSSLYITFKITKKFDTEKLLDLSELKEDRLRECSKDICCILDNVEKSPLQAIRKKFSHPKFYEVAKIKLF